MKTLPVCTIVQADLGVHCEYRAFGPFLLKNYCILCELINIHLSAPDEGKRDNFPIVFHITPLKCCDLSLEPSHRDGSNEGVATYVFVEKLGKLSWNYPQYPLLS